MRILMAVWFAAALTAQAPFDVVIAGGRMMDPESGLGVCRR